MIAGERTANYYAKGIRLVAYGEGEPEVSRPARPPVAAWPLYAARALEDSVAAAFPAWAAPMITALITGEDAGLSGGTYAALQRTGLAHVISVSGLHVVYLAGFLGLLLGRGRRRTAVITIALMAFFAAAVGSGPAVLRAAFMQSMLLLAPLAGRENDRATTLLGILMILLIANPYAAASVSLQLSFASVAGILAFAGRIRPMWKLSFFVGMVAFALAVSVVDRRRMDGIQSEALRAAQMEAQLQRARTDIALHQIKPHFLHNALMSIKVLCRTRPKEAEQAIYDFTIFLRGNMKSLESPEPVPFREEVEAISCYLRIEQIRFRQRLRVVWDLEEDNFSVPPLTIQPLVENAVRHGVCQKPEGGTVTIASRRTEEAILVEITDDGVGFDVSAVEESGGIGIRNLRLRLREQLGAVLDIQSTPGKGTVQTVRIPLRRKEDEDHTGGR